MGEVYEIRPLEWEDMPNRTWVRSRTVMGDYGVCLSRVSGGWQWHSASGNGGATATLESGKTLAEAHYRTRLKHALAPSPLVEAAREVIPHLSTMIGLVRLKYGNLDADVWGAMQDAESAIAKLTAALPQEGA